MTLPTSPLLFIDLAYCGEIFDGRNAEERLDLNRPYATKTYQRSFRITAAAPYGARIGAGVIKEAAKLLYGCHLGQTYASGNVGTDAWAEADITALCTQIRAEPTSDDGEWRVNFLFEPVDPQLISAFEDPLSAPLEISYDNQKFERPLVKEFEGTSDEAPVLNSAGDPFDPPVMRDDSRTLLTIVRNEPLYSAALGYGWLDTTAETYRDTVNSTTFFGRAAGTVKCESITARYVYHPAFYDPGATPPNPGYYAQVTYQFAIDNNGWNKVVLDAGYRTRGSDGIAHQILVDGTPVTSPYPLNGSGGQAPYDAATTHAIVPSYLVFSAYRTYDFATVFGMGS